MEIPSFELLEFLISNAEECEYDLAQSNLPTVSLGDVGPLEDLDLSWAHTGGSPELRKLIARISRVSEDEVLVTQGASEANFLVGLALLDKNSRVVVERPSYEPLWKTFHLLGAKISYQPRPFEEDFGVSVERLARSLPEDTKLLVLTNLYNPGGTVMERGVLSELATLAEERGFYVLVDEIFREAALDREPPCALTIGERFIVTSGLSKFYGLGGLRIGWCLASADAHSKIRAAKNFTSVAPSTLSDALAVRALRMKEKVRQRNRKLIGENRKLVEEWVDRQDSVEWVPPDGYTSFPRFQGNVDELVSIALKRHGTLIAPGSFFGDARHFRLCFGMDTAELESGLDGLARSMKKA